MNCSKKSQKSPYYASMGEAASTFATHKYVMHLDFKISATPQKIS